MTEQSHRHRLKASVEICKKVIHPRTVLLLVGDTESLPPNIWKDQNGQPWVENIPASVLLKPLYLCFRHGPYEADTFTWRTYLNLGEDLLHTLLKVLESEELLECPLLVISQGFAGFIVKQSRRKALRIAYEDPLRFRSFLRCLGGIMLFATPHDTTENKHFWQTVAHIFHEFLNSRKRYTISVEDCRALGSACQDFEKARVDAPIFSLFETNATKIKTSILPLTKTVHFSINCDGQEKARTHAANEELFAVVGDHKVVGKAIIGADTFKKICSFIEICLQDARLRLVHRPPTDEAPSILDHLEELEALNFPTDASTATERNKDKTPHFKSVSSDTTHQASRGSSNPGSKSVSQVFLAADQPSGPKLPFYSVHLARNRDFSGRRREMQAIEDVFFGASESESNTIREEPKTFAICGPGGMGKTQLAAEFCHAHMHRFDAILWVKADEESQLNTSFSRTAVDLGLLAEDSVDARDQVVTRETLKGWLAKPHKDYDPLDEALVKYAKWLLVFDSVDNFEVLRDMWPLDGPGCVLFTSRDSTAMAPGMLAERGLNIPLLDPFEASDLLQKLTKKTDDGHRVAETLGCYPLAITQMAGVIIRQALTFEEFIEAYHEEDGRDELFGMRIDPIAKRSLYPHTLASVLALEGLNHGRALLNVLSILHPDGISEDVLVKGARKVELEGYPKTLSAYRRARAELLQSSLVSKGSEERTIVIHRLIQDTTRSKMSSSMRLLVFLDTVKLISFVWPWSELSSFRHEVERWQACLLIIPHMFQLRLHSSQLTYGEEVFDDALDFARLMTDAGWYSHESSNFRDASEFSEIAMRTTNTLESILEQAAPTSEKYIRSKRLDKLLAEIHHNIGCTATETNDPPSALHHFRTFNQLMTKETEQAADAADPRLAISWNELGNAFMMNKMWEEGGDCYLKSINTFMEMPNNKQSDLSLPQINLALSYWVTGQHQKARDILKLVLKHRELAFGRDDTISFVKVFTLPCPLSRTNLRSSTGRLLHALGNVTYSLGESDTSFDYHLRALKQFGSVLGKNHHRTGDAHVKVAEHFMRRDENPQAIHHLEEALRIFGGRSIYKPERARAHFKRGIALRRVQRDDEASRELKVGCELYNDLDRPGKKDSDGLLEEDFDDMVVFWSR